MKITPEEKAARRAAEEVAHAAAKVRQRAAYDAYMAEAVWQPIATLPDGPAMHVLIRTPDGDQNTWRWMPYRRGSKPPYVGGRWQKTNDYGFRNHPLPTAGEWIATPARITTIQPEPQGTTP